jgi:peptide/nickel transport system substrate-binding protein
MIRGDLAKLGIELRPNVLDRGSFSKRYESNNFDAQIWGGDGGWDAILHPRWYFPSDDESRWAPLWALWYINPNDPRAETPPPRVREQMALYQTLLKSTNPAERNALMRRILEITREEFPVIGISLPENGYGVVRNDFHNVPSKTPFAWTYPNPGPARPEQFFSTRAP